jgi:hypothetical protein
MNFMEIAELPKEKSNWSCSGIALSNGTVREICAGIQD